MKFWNQGKSAKGEIEYTSMRVTGKDPKQSNGNVCLATGVFAMDSRGVYRDTTHDCDSYEETVFALAVAILHLIHTTPMLIPPSGPELSISLMDDYDKGGYFDIGTFACGICLANGITYKPCSDKACSWLKINAEELQIDGFVGRDGRMINLCPDCAKTIGEKLENMQTNHK